MNENHAIFKKIDEGTVTLDDFNQLISEATPESMRDRLRRRPMAQRRTVKSHQDEEGHSDLQQPKIADRVQPKREREGRTQMQGRGELGHRHSARTQKRTMSKSLREFNSLTPRLRKAIQYIQENYGKPPKISEIEDRMAMVAVAKKMMTKPGINRDWFKDLIRCVNEDFEEYEGLEDHDEFDEGGGNTVYADDTIEMWEGLKDILGVEDSGLYEMLGLTIGNGGPGWARRSWCSPDGEIVDWEEFLIEKWYNVITQMSELSHSYRLEGPHSSSGDFEVVIDMKPENDNELGNAIDRIFQN